MSDPLELAGAAFRRGDLDSAESLYHAAEAIMPADPSITFNLGLIAALRGDLVTALERCGDGLERASVIQRDEMEASVRNDSRLAVLRMLLFQGDQDI